MASITEQKMKEMEAEMDRFEEEISTVQEAAGLQASKFILGAQTYSHVQQQLQQQVGHPGAAVSTGGMLLQAPPPPPPASTAPGYDQSQSNYALAPPPPPPGPSPDGTTGVQPSPTPSFLPPQLRHRPPRPPPPMGMPPRPPMGMPPRGPPPMGPPGMGMRPPPLGPPGMSPRMHRHMMYSNRYDDNRNSAVIIAKPKIVYQAPPVKKAKKRKAKKEKEKEVAEEAPPEVAPPPAREESPEYEQPPPMVDEDTTPVNMEMEEFMGEVEEEPGSSKKGKAKKKKVVRTAAGVVWEDDSLLEWDPDDFRIFCGDLGNEVTDEILTRAFSKYGSFVKAKVCRDKRTNKTRGYGFVSFKDPTDFVRAMREMNGKYVGNRPIKLRKSTWKDRNIESVKKKDREKKRLGLR